MTKRVEIEVIESQSNGIRVQRLNDGREGIIRARELSWDERVAAERPSFAPGTRLEAAVLRETDTTLQLSLRQLTNPWADSDKKFKKGQLVRGEIVGVRQFGAFVQVAPGINAILRPRDVPLRRGQSIKDIFDLGDQVQGLITRFDPNRQRMSISLTRRLEELSVRPEFRQMLQVELLQDNNSAGARVAQTAPPLAQPLRPAQSAGPLMPLPERILIVDDNAQEGAQVQALLASHLGAVVELVESGTAAFTHLDSSEPYDLIILDLDLGEERGTDLAARLLAYDEHLPLIITSKSTPDEDALNAIARMHCLFSLKVPQQIVDLVLKMSSDAESAPVPALAYGEAGHFVRELGMAELVTQSHTAAMQQLLQQLSEQTDGSQTLVLEVTAEEERVSLLATYPSLDPQLAARLPDGLYYSPVQDAVVDGEPFYATNVNQRQNKRLQNFFPLLPYRTCLCLPLEIAGMRRRHVLVLLNARQTELTESAKRAAELTAVLLQVVLERALLLDFMQRYEQRYTQGQLLGSLVHEAMNKLDTLEGNLRTLPNLLDRAATTNQPAARQDYLREAKEIAQDLHAAKTEITELVHAYTRISRGDLEAVDVNQITEKVMRQMAKKAQEEGITLVFEPAEAPPPVQAVQSSLEQILTNILLNAIQQISHQRRRMATIAAERARDFALLQQGVVIVTTEHMPDAPYPVQIAVYDTGPGIPYHMQEQIFMLDTSMRRGGHGLGLFISRNLIQQMGGRLRLADSILFIGTLFVVDLLSSD